jgi:hypothetical protein
MQWIYDYLGKKQLFLASPCFIIVSIDSYNFRISGLKNMCNFL